MDTAFYSIIILIIQYTHIHTVYSLYSILILILYEKYSILILYLVICISLLFCPCLVACGILVPQPGIEPMFPMLTPGPPGKS